MLAVLISVTGCDGRPVGWNRSAIAVLHKHSSFKWHFSRKQGFLHKRERGKMREKNRARTNRDSQVFITAVHRGYVHTVNVLLTGSHIVLFKKQLTVAFKYCMMDN